MTSSCIGTINLGFDILQSKLQAEGMARPGSVRGFERSEARSIQVQFLSGAAVSGSRR